MRATRRGITPGDAKRDLQAVGVFAETVGLPARPLRCYDQFGLFRLLMAIPTIATDAASRSSSRS